MHQKDTRFGNEAKNRSMKLKTSCLNEHLKFQRQIMVVIHFSLKDTAQENKKECTKTKPETAKFKRVCACIYSMWPLLCICAGPSELLFLTFNAGSQMDWKWDESNSFSHTGVWCQNRFCELEGVLQAMRSSGIVARIGVRMTRIACYYWIRGLLAVNHVQRILFLFSDRF